MKGQIYGNKFYTKPITNMIGKIQVKVLMHYKGKKFIKYLFKEINHELTRPTENYMIYSLAKSQTGKAGNMAEVGTYMGDSGLLIAKAIKESGSNKKLFMFDTFEGLPVPSSVDKEEKHLKEGEYMADFDYVRRRFSDYENVSLFKGYFPKETGRNIENERFSFVHLDLDLYEPTKESLEFFYPRLENGGIILTHDYSRLIGVKKAFDEYFKGKEVIYELADSQAFIIKE